MCGGGSSPEPREIAHVENWPHPVTPTSAPAPEQPKVPEPTPAPTPAPVEAPVTAPAAPSAPVTAGGAKKGRAVSSIKQGLMSTVRNVQQRGRPVLQRKSKAAAASMFDKSTKDLLGQ